MITDIHLYKDDGNVFLDLTHWNEIIRCPIKWTESMELTDKQYLKVIDFINTLGVR